MAVTLICIGIPVCRPVYRRIYYHFYPEKQTSGYRKHKCNQHGSNAFALETIGGGVNHSAKKDLDYGNSEDGDSFSGAKVSGVGHFWKARGGKPNRRAGTTQDDASDEEILGGDYWRNQVQPHHANPEPGIKVTETVSVDRS